MDKFISTANGGIPRVLDDNRWARGQESNQGIIQALEQMLRGENNNDDFILQGCLEGGSPGAVTLTEGWIILGGELLKVDAQSAFNEATDNKFVKSTSFDAAGDKTLLNGTTAETYEKNRANISGTSGNLAFNGNRILGDLRQDYATPTFAAGDFVAGGGGPWTVEAGDVTTNRFLIIGKTMFWELKLENTTTAGAVTELLVTIPSGKKARNEWSMICRTRDNANLNETVLISVNLAGDTSLEILHLDLSSWPNSTNNHDLYFNVSFEIE